MLITIFAMTMTVFIFLFVGTLTTVAIFALKCFIECADRISWNFMFQREIKRWKKKNEKH